MKITRRQLKRIIRKMLLENSKVQTIEQGFIERVESGSAGEDDMESDQ